MPSAQFENIEGVHPVTGLATDYLNHYNEIVMLLDLVPSMPECIEDAVDWQPKSYCDHFRDSGLAIADGVIDAYQNAPTSYRAAFEETVHILDEFLEPAIALIAQTVDAGKNDQAAHMTAETLETARGLLGRLNGIIHGHAAPEQIELTDDTDAAQALADAMF